MNAQHVKQAPAFDIFRLSSLAFWKQSFVPNERERERERERLGD